MKRFLTAGLTLAMLLGLAVPAAAVDSVPALGTGEIPENLEITTVELDEAELQKQLQEQMNAAITAAGGVPGQINVMWNGKCIPFTDAAPEIQNGRTMVPVRAIMEDMGAEVDFENNTVTCTLNGVTTAFAIGGTEATVTKDGKTETVQMDSPSYLKNDRTYVPVRLLSEASGYDVYWDNAVRTAVIVDRDAMVERLNENLTIYNEIVKNQMEQMDLTKAYEIDYDLSAKATMLDSVNGDETYSLTGDMNVLWKGSDYEITGTLDLKQIVELLQEKGVIEQGELTDEMTEQLKALEFTVLMGSEGYWVSMPLMTTILATQDATVAGKDVWFDVNAIMGMDMSSLLASSMTAMQGGAAMGELLYDSTISTLDMLSDMGMMSYFTIYQQVETNKTMLDAMLGDDTFTKTGSTYKWELDLDDFTAMMGSMGVPFDPTQLEGADFTMSMTVKANGDTDMSMKLSLDESLLGLTAIDFTMDGTSTMEKGDFTMKLQVKNYMDAELTMDYTMKPTTKTPAVKPPEGAVIVDNTDSL